MEVDEALVVVGGYRRFHLGAFFLLGFSSLLTVATQSLVFVFIARTAPHHCRPPKNTSASYNVTTSDSCFLYMYANSSEEGPAIPCTQGWSYPSPDGDHTIVMEWDLVCEDSVLAELPLVVYAIGGAVGELMATILADKLGRRWVHVLSYLLVSGVGAALAFVPTYPIYVSLLPIVAFASAGGSSVADTHLFELFDSRRRSFAGIGIEFLWVLAYVYMALLGWLLRDWRQLQLTISLSALIGLMNAMIPESPLWLLANHHRQAAERVLHKMARYNGIKLELPIRLKEAQDNTLNNKCDGEPLAETSTTKAGEQWSHPDNPPENTGQETILDLFRWPLLRKYTIISIFLCFANNVVYFFLILSTPSMSGNFYFNFFIGGVIEIPAFVLSFYLIRHGRRVATSVSLLLAATCLLIMPFLPEHTASGVNLGPLVTTVAMLGKFSVTVSMAFMVLYTKEYFPTNLRSTSGGVCNMLGRLGTMQAPFAIYAAKHIAWLPPVLLGSLSVVVAFATLQLPETKDWPLPQSIADVYRYSYRNRHAPGVSKEDE